MKLGNKFLFFIFVFLFLATPFLILLKTKILSSPLINLEELKPSFEEEENY